MSYIEIIGAETDRLRIGMNLSKREAEIVATALRWTTDGDVMDSIPNRTRVLRRIADQLSQVRIHHDADLRLRP